GVGGGGGGGAAKGGRALGRRLRRRAAVRRVARQRTARLARHPPDRPAGGQDHPGAAPMTAANLLKSPAVPAGTARRNPAGIRLAWLHLRTPPVPPPGLAPLRPRRVPGAVLALAVCGVVLHVALHWHWAFNSGPYAQQVPMIIEAGAASVIAVSAHSPFGETERATGRSLPYLRLLAAIGLT